MNFSGSSEVRLDHSLNESERLHVANRRVTVQQCLQKHNIPCSVDEVPTIALLGSGGGERAMIGLLGSLSQLYEERLLDCTMYLSGVSGSTWCMASVYKEPDWSTNMKTVKQNIIKKLNSDEVGNNEKCYKLKKMSQRENFSLTDIWAVLIGSRIVKEIDEGGLTEHRGQHTKDPYPIYMVIDKQCKYDRLSKDSWFEITPDECGYSLTGAFVDSKFLGSPFKNGAKTQEHPENDMLYLQGLCGSALADGEEIKKTILGWLKTLFGISLYSSDTLVDEDTITSTLLELNLHFISGEDVTNDINSMNELLEGMLDKEGNEVKFPETLTEEILEEYTLKVCDCLSDWFPNTGDMKEMTPYSFGCTETQACMRVQSLGSAFPQGGVNEEMTPYSFESAVPQAYMHMPSFGMMSVIRKCIKKLWNWDWGTHYNFLYKMTAGDVHHSILQSETRNYEDAGLLLNSPYFSVLRKARNVDLIISLDFSAGDPFETVDKAAQICKELQIPFPTVEHHETEEEVKDFYVFKDNPNAPTVIHIPLFNAVNCKGEVNKWRNTYKTFQMSYTDEMIRNLLGKAALNIKNTKEKLLKEIKEVIKRKKH